MPSSVALVLALVSVMPLGCRGGGQDSTDPSAKPSPQADAQPAQLVGAHTALTGMTSAMPEGGPPPTPLRPHEVMPADVLTRESHGYTLSAVFRHTNLTGPPRGPEVNAAGVEAARLDTELRVAIDLSHSRMRLAIGSRGFVLPTDTEIRARADRYGFVVVWSGGTSYRPLAPGSMRALLGERRFDVAPLAPAEVEPRKEGGRRIGIRTQRAVVTTRAAEATFEIGKLEGAGEGGALICRLLLDLMNAPPNTRLCGLDELPVRAELRWIARGAFTFELTGALRRSDIPASSLAVPPATAAFAPSPLPVPPLGVMLSPAELAALRTADVDVPADPSGAGEALVLVNPSVELRLLFLDGVPIAWVGPGGRGEVRGLRRGKYVAQWRTFLGDDVETAITQIVPGVAQVGSAPDAGS